MAASIVLVLGSVYKVPGRGGVGCGLLYVAGAGLVAAGWDLYWHANVLGVGGAANSVPKFTSLAILC